MDEISEVFFTENECGKINFPFWKTKFGTHWEFCAYRGIFGFSKGSSKGKSVYNYVTKCLYNLLKIPCLK